MLRIVNEKAMRDLLARRLKVDMKRTAAEALNKASAQVLIGAKGVKGAVHLTPKATAGRIRSDLNRKYHAWTFGARSHSVKLVYLLASKRLKKLGRKFVSFTWWNEMVKEETLRIWKARDSSRAFLAAGWLPAVRELGYTKHRALGGINRPAGRAARGGAIKATPDNLTTLAYNAAVGSDAGGGDDPKAHAIADAALQIAIGLAVKDLEKYVMKKEMEAALKRHSDR